VFGYSFETVRARTPQTPMKVYSYGGESQVDVSVFHDHGKKPPQTLDQEGCNPRRRDILEPKDGDAESPIRLT
jgi:hypothetical protein